MRVKFGICMVLFLLLSASILSAESSGEKLKDMELVSGDANGNLQEGANLTRAELATLLCRLNGVADEAKVFSKSAGFSDVNPTAWFAGYVNYAKEKGWMNGVGNGIFSPNANVNEEMVATVMLRVLGYQPKWGDAIYSCQGLGIETTYQLGEYFLTREEVFNYIWSMMPVKGKNQDLAFYEQLNINLNFSDYLVLRSFEEGKNYDVNLNEIEESVVSNSAIAEVEYTDQGEHYIHYQGKTYGPYGMGYDNEIDDTSLYSNESELALVDDTTGKLTVRAHLASDMLRLTYANKYYALYTDYWIIHEDGLNDYEIRDIQDKTFLQGEDSKFIVLHNNKLAILSKDKKCSIYDMVTKTKLAEYEKIENVISIKDNYFVLVYADDIQDKDLSFVNVQTKSVSNFKVPVSDSPVKITWLPGSEVLAVGYLPESGGAYSHLVQPTKGLLTTINGFVSEELEGAKDLFIVSEVAYPGWEDAIGLVNINAKEFLAIDYSAIRIDKYVNGDVIAAYKEDGTSVTLSLLGVQVEESSLIYFKDILPNGGYILDYAGEVSRAEYYNNMDELVLEKNSLNYLPGFDLISSYNDEREIEFYQLDGSAATIPIEVSRCYSIAYGYLAVLMDGQNYVVNSDFEIIAGPFDSKYYIRW